MSNTTLVMFAQRLKAIRKGRKITLKELAKQLNLKFKNDPHRNTSSQIGNWERGLRAPSFVEIKKLSEFFDVSMDYLVGRSNVNCQDLAGLLTQDHDLTFRKHHLSSDDQYQIYQLITGYLTGKSQRHYHHNNDDDQQENLNLNLK